MLMLVIYMYRSDGMKEKKINIFIVDDHPIVVDGIKSLLQNESDLNICGSAQDAGSALDYFLKQLPDLVIIDISLKDGMNGIELTKCLKGLYPDILILVLSMYDEFVYAERALKAGASGYIMKNELSTTIIKAIRTVLSGNIYVSERFSSKLLNYYFRGKPERDEEIISLLSDREFEIFQLLGNGYRTKEVANKLNLSVKTVETYKQRIKEKLALKSSPELTKFAIEWIKKK